MAHLSIETNSKIDVGACPRKLLRRPRPPKLVPLPPIPPPAPPKEQDMDSLSLTESFVDQVLNDADDSWSTPPMTHPSHPSPAFQEGPPVAQRRAIPLTIAPWEKRYVLDPMFVSRSTTTQRTRPQEKLTQQRRPRGPDPLPTREPLKPLHPSAGYFDFDGEDLRYLKPPLFTLNNFLIKLSEAHGYSLESVTKAMLSSQNYKRITELVIQQLQPLHTTLCMIDLDEEVKDSMPAARSRIPARQVLIEMTSIIKEQMTIASLGQVDCKVRPLPKYDPNFRLGEAPHTEIVVFEHTGSQELGRYVQFEHIYEHPDREALFSAGGGRHFMDGQRSDSPFTAGDDQISPAEVCVLDSIMNGGTALSLKANFAHRMPDIGSLIHTLTYINLSYNTFPEIPSALFSVRQLEVLKMRNNPVKVMPDEIDKFESLNTLILSFCLISSVPQSLYNLKHLKHLDLSYNKLSVFHNEIYKLSELKDLILDGNEFYWLPWGILKLRLRHLRVRQNFMHPMMWADLSRARPQKLVHLAALAFMHGGMDRFYEVGLDDSTQQKLPVPNQEMAILQNQQRCDCCLGLRYGPGMPIIRPCKKHFGVRMLPIFFRSCSPTCWAGFREKGAEIVEMLYQGAINFIEEEVVE